MITTNLKRQQQGFSSTFYECKHKKCKVVSTASTTKACQLGTISSSPCFVHYWNDLSFKSQNKFCPSAFLIQNINMGVSLSFDLISKAKYVSKVVCCEGTGTITLLSEEHLFNQVTLTMKLLFYCFLCSSSSSQPPFECARFSGWFLGTPLCRSSFLDCLSADGRFMCSPSLS